MKSESLHPAASHHLPSFITAPGETDVLMVVMAIILLGSVVAFGILFLRLHTLPERIAHKSDKLQFEIVAVLGLISLFTHMHIFWIAGLLLALIDLPDFGGWLGRIAVSLETMAAKQSRNNRAVESAGNLVDVNRSVAPEEISRKKIAAVKQVRDGPSINPALDSEKRKEPTNA